MDKGLVGKKMRISLRAFVAEDIQLIQQWIHTGNLSYFMSRWSPHDFIDGSWPKDLVRWHTIILEGREIGTVWMERDSSTSKTCDLGILIGDPAFRGHGAGSQAILLAELDAAAHWGADLVRLRVRASNSRAIRCYQKAGYLLSGVTQKDIDGVMMEVMHMEHSLIAHKLDKPTKSVAPTGYGRRRFSDGLAGEG